MLIYICLNLFYTVLKHLKRIYELIGHKQLYNDNLRKSPNEYGDVSIMHTFSNNIYYKTRIVANRTGFYKVSMSTENIIHVHYSI